MSNSTTSYDIPMPIRRRRSKIPLCLRCDAKPAKPELKFFCSQRCAVAYAVYLSEGMRWCDACNHWIVPGFDAMHDTHMVKIYMGTTEPAPMPPVDWP